MRMKGHNVITPRLQDIDSPFSDKHLKGHSESQWVLNLEHGIKIKENSYHITLLSENMSRIGN